MTLETFKVLIAKIKDNSDTLNFLYPKIDLINFTDGYEEVITILLKSYYGEIGEDWISWFLHERDPEKGLIAHDSHGNEICTNVEELWKLCEECKLTKVDYIIPTPLTDEQRMKMLENIFSSK